MSQIVRTSLSSWYTAAGTVRGRAVSVKH